MSTIDRAALIQKSLEEAYFQARKLNNAGARRLQDSLVECIWRVKGIENGERERIKDLEIALTEVRRNALAFWM